MKERMSVESYRKRYRRTLEEDGDVSVKRYVRQMISYQILLDDPRSSQYLVDLGKVIVEETLDALIRIDGLRDDCLS